MSGGPAAASRGGEVSLREVTGENLDAVLALAVAPEQQTYVASNAKSIAQAHFHPEAWFRAIYAGDTPAGFLMLHDENLRPEPRRDEHTACGFRPTGRVEDGEIELVREL